MEDKYQILYFALKGIKEELLCFKHSEFLLHNCLMEEKYQFLHFELKGIKDQLLSFKHSEISILLLGTESMAI